MGLWSKVHNGESAAYLGDSVGCPLAYQHLYCITPLVALQSLSVSWLVLDGRGKATYLGSCKAQWEWDLTPPSAVLCCPTSELSHLKCQRKNLWSRLRKAEGKRNGAEEERAQIGRKLKKVSENGSEVVGDYSGTEEESAALKKAAMERLCIYSPLVFLILICCWTPLRF